MLFPHAVVGGVPTRKEERKATKRESRKNKNIARETPARETPADNTDKGTLRDGEKPVKNQFAGFTIFMTLLVGLTSCLGTVMNRFLGNDTDELQTRLNEKFNECVRGVIDTSIGNASVVARTLETTLNKTLQCWANDVFKIKPSNKHVHHVSVRYAVRGGSVVYIMSIYYDMAYTKENAGVFRGYGLIAYVKDGCLRAMLNFNPPLKDMQDMHDLTDKIETLEELKHVFHAIATSIKSKKLDGAFWRIFGKLFENGVVIAGANNLRLSVGCFVIIDGDEQLSIELQDGITIVDIGTRTHDELAVHIEEVLVKQNKFKYGLPIVRKFLLEFFTTKKDFSVDGELMFGGGQPTLDRSNDEPLEEKFFPHNSLGQLHAIDIADTLNGLGHGNTLGVDFTNTTLENFVTIYTLICVYTYCSVKDKTSMFKEVRSIALSLGATIRPEQTQQHSENMHAVFSILTMKYAGLSVMGEGFMVGKLKVKSVLWLFLHSIHTSLGTFEDGGGKIESKHPSLLNIKKHFANVGMMCKDLGEDAIYEQFCKSIGGPICAILTSGLDVSAWDALAGYFSKCPSVLRLIELMVKSGIVLLFDLDGTVLYANHAYTINAIDKKGFLSIRSIADMLLGLAEYNIKHEQSEVFSAGIDFGSNPVFIPVNGAFLKAFVVSEVRARGLKCVLIDDSNLVAMMFKISAKAVAKGLASSDKLSEEPKPTTKRTEKRSAKSTAKGTNMQNPIQDLADVGLIQYAGKSHMGVMILCVYYAMLRYSPEQVPSFSQKIAKKFWAIDGTPEIKYDDLYPNQKEACLEFKKYRGEGRKLIRVGGEIGSGKSAAIMYWFFQFGQILVISVDVFMMSDWDVGTYKLATDPFFKKMFACLQKEILQYNVEKGWAIIMDGRYGKIDGFADITMASNMEVSFDHFERNINMIIAGRRPAHIFPAMLAKTVAGQSDTTFLEFLKSRGLDLSRFCQDHESEDQESCMEKMKDFLWMGVCLIPIQDGITNVPNETPHTHTMYGLPNLMKAIAYVVKHGQVKILEYISDNTFYKNEVCMYRMHIIKCIFDSGHVAITHATTYARNLRSDGHIISGMTDSQLKDNGLEKIVDIKLLPNIIHDPRWVIALKSLSN